MRFAPLIPLALLGAGALVVEGIHLEDIDQASSETLLEVQAALVTSTGAQGKSNFTATSLEIGLAATNASEVRGEYATPTITHRFAAAHMRRHQDTDALVLQGDVELWHGNYHLRANLATIRRDGAVTGHGDVRVTDERSEAQADAFALDQSGAIRLEGNVRMKLRQ